MFGGCKALGGLFRGAFDSDLDDEFEVVVFEEEVKLGVKVGVGDVADVEFEGEDVEGGGDDV